MHISLPLKLTEVYFKSISYYLFYVISYLKLLLHCNSSITVTIFFQEVLEGREGPAFPAARVVPTNGELFWLVDDPAAASLTIEVERLSSGAKL